MQFIHWIQSVFPNSLRTKMLCCKPNNNWCHFHSRMVFCDLLVIRSCIFLFSSTYKQQKHCEYLLLANNTWFTAFYCKFLQLLLATIVCRHVGIQTYMFPSVNDSCRSNIDTLAYDSILIFTSFELPWLCWLETHDFFLLQRMLFILCEPNWKPSSRPVTLTAVCLTHGTRTADLCTMFAAYALLCSSIRGFVPCVIMPAL